MNYLKIEKKFREDVTSKKNAIPIIVKKGLLMTFQIRSNFEQMCHKIKSIIFKLFNLNKYV